MCIVVDFAFDYHFWKESPFSALCNSQQKKEKNCFFLFLGFLKQESLQDVALIFCWLFIHSRYNVSDNENALVSWIFHTTLHITINFWAVTETHAHVFLFRINSILNRTFMQNLGLGKCISELLLISDNTVWLILVLQ